MNGRPLWTVTHADFKTLDIWFDDLPLTCGKAPWHRKAETTHDQICREAAERVDDGEYEGDVIGLHVGTTNKHFRKLGRIQKFIREQIGVAMPLLDFGMFIAPDDERAAALNERDFSSIAGNISLSLQAAGGCHILSAKHCHLRVGHGAGRVQTSPDDRHRVSCSYRVRRRAL